MQLLARPAEIIAGDLSLAGDAELAPMDFCSHGLLSRDSLPSIPGIQIPGRQLAPVLAYLDVESFIAPHKCRPGVLGSGQGLIDSVASVWRRKD